MLVCSASTAVRSLLRANLDQKLKTVFVRMVFDALDAPCQSLGPPVIEQLMLRAKVSDTS